MASRPTTDVHTRPVNLRIREDVRNIIDRAASLRGKSRSDFMIDAAYRAAEDTLLDQTLVRVDKPYSGYGDLAARETLTLRRRKAPFQMLSNVPPFYSA